jgi:hypothetical protein
MFRATITPPGLGADARIVGQCLAMRVRAGETAELATRARIFAADKKACVVRRALCEGKTRNEDRARCKTAIPPIELAHEIPLDCLCLSRQV